MNITHTYIRAFVFALALIVASPHAAHAAVVHADALGTTVGAHKQLVVRVLLTTKESPINAVSGSVHIPAGMHIDTIDTAGSAFSLWIESPKLILSDSVVEFSGGVPHGVPPNSDVLLFTIRAHADTAGTYTLTPQNIVAYKNDGKGTVETSSGIPTAVTVDTSTTEQVAAPVSQETPLVADIGRDAALFDGKYFVAFYGGDTGSGVQHYEVTEGWLGTPQNVERFYVINDQSLKTRIVVRAIGTDGEVVATTVSGVHTENKTLYVGVFIALLFLVLVALRKRINALLIRR